MKHLIVNGKAARLEMGEAHFRYAPESGDALEHGRNDDSCVALGRKI